MRERERERELKKRGRERERGDASLARDNLAGEGRKRRMKKEGKNGRASGAKLAAREGARHRVYEPNLIRWGQLSL